MGDIYQYPVFFECATLNLEQKKRIENYFHIRRKSGGGECGSVTNVNDKVYSIAFKEREAQQRVLQKSQHELNFPDCTLVLNVRNSPAPHSSSSISPSSPGQPVGLTPDISSSQKQQPSLASSLPPRGEDYEPEVDSYLFRYLTECPNAEKELETELASVNCSAQIFPDKVLVRRLSQPAAVDDKWKAEVKKVFDGYLIHYEVDPRKVKALLQSSRSPQQMDKVKVYCEAGLTVVVGKQSHVEAKLLEFKDTNVKSQASGLSEKQTSRRLGEAKLRLLWREIEQGLGEHFPEVKATQSDAGQLVLEGSVEDILKAGQLVSEKEQLVSEYIVSDKSPQFLAFLRRVYGGPGVLGDFLGVGDKVEIELRDTELHFFAFSTNKLHDAEKKVQEKFKDVRLEVPTCSVVPPELQEKLNSKTNELNQGQCRAQVVFGLDSTVHLVGHTKEVDELSDIVTQFILDQASVEGQVILPFPELVERLLELLHLLNFDFSGITIHPLPFSSRPMVVLEGPSGKVTVVRNRLGPLLQSLVQDRVTIRMPGAVRFFESLAGKDSLLSVGQSHRCLLQLEEQLQICRQNSGIAKYNLCDGLQVLVCQGDITTQYADALVNAANEDLNHGGGVAAALSKAGGPQVQKESTALVKQNGKIRTGDVVATTGGNLKCKKLLHVVGPVGGKCGGKERALLEKAVSSALYLAESMAFKSIAMPCISSGLFHVPLTVCSEAIVTAIKEFGKQGGRCLSKIILIDKKGEVVRSMQDACDKILPGTSTRNYLGFQPNPSVLNTVGGATAGATGGSVQVEIIQGALETQQVDALVSPMLAHDPLSSRVGNVLSNVVGPQMTARFNREAGGATLPGEIVLVENLPPLTCKALIFLNLVPWDNNQNGTAVQALRQGIRKILASCQIRGFSSVALPMVGTGAVLRFPHGVVSRVLLEEVDTFEKNRNNSAPFLVRIVIHPGNKESSKAFQSAQGNVHLRGFTNDANPGQESFYRHVSVTDHEVTIMLGGVKLQMVRGDITNGATDVIVNTTDFSNNPSGVSKAILTAAGPTVQAELAKKGNPSDDMCTTGPGMLRCKEIIHAHFRCDPQLIRKKCKKILESCESKGYNSVSFPAINTGMAGMAYDKACKAMLDGMASAIAKAKPKYLSLIHIVIMEQPVFQAFRTELENRFGQIVPYHITLREKAKQKLKKWQERHSKFFSSAPPQEKTFVSSKPHPAVIHVISCGHDITIQSDLEVMLQKQLIKKEVDVDDISRLDPMELDAVQAKVKVLGISLEKKRCQSSENSSGGNAIRPDARDRSGKDVYVLEGLKEDVLSVTDLISKATQKALRKDLLDKEEAMVALNVQWSLKDTNGEWHEVSLHDNCKLENAYSQNQKSDMVAPDGSKMIADPKAREARNVMTGITYSLKRTESGALELPKQWDHMQEEIFKKVALQPNSQEYREIAKGFLKKANYNICKIERVQNVYLWNAYSVCKQRILAKNGPADLREMTLYHGTSADTCNCIEQDRFDRSYAGKHAALYGKGVYFAVNAEYSAQKFSPADAAGLKRLYVARVLTGRYTLGNSKMISPPPRGSDPTDCYDSLVDNQQNPTMFVIFHDDQAYPQYLITFR